MNGDRIYIVQINSYLKKKSHIAVPGCTVWHFSLRSQVRQKGHTLGADAQKSLNFFQVHKFHLFIKFLYFYCKPRRTTPMAAVFT